MVQIASSVAVRVLAHSAGADGRKREILAAASRVFRRRGLEQAGMREIAAELGMTAGNLYYYFRSKADLVRFCQETTLDALLAGGAAVRLRPVGAAEQLFGLLTAHVVCLNETYPGSLAHLETEALEDGDRAALLAKRKRYEQLYAELLELGQASGELRPLDTGLAVRALLGAVNWTVKWFQPDGGKSAEAVGRDIAELLVRGLLAPGTPFKPGPAFTETNDER
jgi:TetR/AcrR family transcriptional regulator, cholesterol catabolism regulator